MKWPLTAVRRAALLLFVGSMFVTSLSAQSTSTLTRIALFEPVGQGTDPTLAAVLSTVANSVELSLVLLQRYDVRRLPPADPEKDLPRMRSYCEANHIDQAILGSGSKRPEGGFAFRLLVYDRKSDSITIDRQGTSTGALDMFDTTDTLVASLLDGLSGTHLLFGSVTVDTDPPGATISVNGRDAGAGPLSLRGLPVGTVQLLARASGREDAQASVTINDGETASVTLKLARSLGKLAVQMPTDGQVTVTNPEIGQKEISGPGVLDLPTGDYQLQATSPGLAAASVRITVGRNATANWLPWTRGYLVVEAVPEGAVVVVDGVARGAAPLVVEVDPGVLHKVQVTKDKYDTFVKDLISAAGTKTLIKTELTGLPGSVSVTTSMPGAGVQLDERPWVQTPFLFKDVPAGSHRVSIMELRKGDGLFTAGPPIQIVVSPAERVDVVKEIVRGKAHLTIQDAPPGSTVQIEGKDVDSAQALTGGLDVLAGVVNVNVTGPDAQKWNGSFVISSGQDFKASIYSLSWLIPQRSISLEGGIDQWSGLLPTWNKPFPTPFSRNQPGTRISKGYVSRDASFLYVRFEFADGTPSTKLSDTIKQVLSYKVLIYTDHNEADRVTIGVLFGRDSIGGATASANLGVRNPGRSTWTGLDPSRISFRIGQDSLLVRVPLDSIRRYVDGTSRISLMINTENSKGQGINWFETEKRSITFGF